MLHNLPVAVQKAMEETAQQLASRPKLQKMFLQCFPNTLETTTELLEDGTTFVITGDIPAMWLRDSTAQVRHYVGLAKDDADVARIIRGLIQRQFQYILIEPYANAFNKEPNNQGHKGDRTKQNPWVWERKYEIDSLCYPIQLAYLYWKATGDASIFDENFKKAAHTIVELWKTEQNHQQGSPYFFIRNNCPRTDTIPNHGKGMPVNFTGMTWAGFRPSDDSCIFGYNIPGNMFAVVALGYLAEIVDEIYKDGELKLAAIILRDEIHWGIQNYGTVLHPKYGRIYAYETDGFGNYHLMDDANVPSLLSIPYMGYASVEDPIYQATRKFVLSTDNPYYFEGKSARGIGSPHTPPGYIWHISLVMQALTSNDLAEIRYLVDVLESTDADTGYMHEGFDPNDPKNFTRSWFAWANSLFGELIYKLVREGKI